MEQNTTATFPTLLAWREAQELTQSGAAEFLGMSQGRYSQLERGLPTNRYQAEYLAEKTGVPVESLVKAS